jgi:hypothetical protein
VTLAVEKDGFKIGKCKLCGAPIVWADNDAGGRIPLDPKAPIFGVRRHEGIDGAYARQFKKIAVGMMHGHGEARMLVSHFSTCPAKTRAYGLLREAAAAFRQTGSGVYPTCEEASALIKKINDYLRIDGP